MKNVKIFGIILIITGLVMMGAFSGCGSPAATPSPEIPQVEKEEAKVDEELEPIELTVATGLDERSVWNESLWKLMEIVEERSDGKITLRYIGGPEVFPPFELGDTVREGIVDIGHTPGAYYNEAVPEIEAMVLSTLTPMEEREKGIYDLWGEIHESKLGVYYLGKLGSVVPFGLFTNVRIEEADLTGYTIRVSPVMFGWIQGLGGEPVRTATDEIYPGMERAVFDGFTWPISGAVLELGLHEVTNYLIEPQVFQSDLTTIMNMDKWNSLSEQQKDVLTSAIIEAEEWSVGFFKQEAERDKQDILNTNIELLELPPDEAVKFIEIGREAIWNRVISNSPTFGEKLRQLYE